MISFLSPLPVGNAVRCLLAPAEGATVTRVLRKLTDDIVNETDPAAAVVYEGDEVGFVDTATLVNGQRYYYRAFDHVNGSWVASDSAGVTVTATAEGIGPDPFTLLRDRLEAGLKVEVDAGRLRHETGKIPVLTAPPAFENTKWPVVSLSLPSDAPQERGIGELVSPDAFDPDAGEWLDAEGWLSMVQISVVGWSINSDERHDLRKAIKRVVQGNLPVFADAGLSLVTFSQNTVDEMEAYAAPIYSVPGTFSCLAPASVQSASAPISDATVSASLP